MGDIRAECALPMQSLHERPPITTYQVDPENVEYKYEPSLLQARHDFWENARGSYRTEISELIEK